MRNRRYKRGDVHAAIVPAEYRWRERTPSPLSVAATLTMTSQRGWIRVVGGAKGNRNIMSRETGTYISRGSLLLLLVRMTISSMDRGRVAEAITAGDGGTRPDAQMTDYSGIRPSQN